MKNSGFTLIETLIYIALFTIVIGGGMIATYQIITSTAASNNHIIMEEEANFLLRKINWALTGSSAYTVVATPPSLSVTKSGVTLLFDLNSNNLQLKRAAASAVVLNSSNIGVSNLVFANATGGNGVTTSFTLTTIQSGETITENFMTTKYIRQ